MRVYVYNVGSLHIGACLFEMRGPRRQRFDLQTCPFMAPGPQSPQESVSCMNVAGGARVTFLAAIFGFSPSGLSFLHSLAHQPLRSLCAVIQGTPRTNEKSSPRTQAEHMLCAGAVLGLSFWSKTGALRARGVSL